MRADARICCFDLDTFFVSVERLLDPSLRDKPVVVGGHEGGRGVVVSASYEVRPHGVRSGMSIKEASALAPRGTVFLPGHHDEYTKYSGAARDFVERYSPIVVAASIDEHYIDFRGCESLYRRPIDPDDDGTIVRTVREMLAAVQSELGLPASVGIATSTSTAKVACGLAKPHGALLVRAGTERATLAPLAVRKLPGIGPVSEAKLIERGIRTLADLAAAPDAVLRPIFGAYTAGIRRDAVGEGRDELGRERPAFREHDPRGLVLGTISNERTFAEESHDATLAILAGLCERVCARARRRGVKAGCVTLKLRYTSFHTISRSRTLATPTSVDVELHEAVLDMYRDARTGTLPIRLLGVGISRLVPDDMQRALFDRDDRRGRAVDDVREKFGYDAMHLATTLLRRRRGSTTPR